MGSSPDALGELQPLLRLIVMGTSQGGGAGGEAKGWSATDKWSLGLDELVTEQFK